MAFGFWAWMGPRNRVRWGPYPYPPWVGASLGERGTYCKVWNFCCKLYNKSSAVAEMGDVATVDMGEERGAAVPLSRGRRGSWVPV